MLYSTRVPGGAGVFHRGVQSANAVVLWRSCIHELAWATLRVVGEMLCRHLQCLCPTFRMFLPQALQCRCPLVLLPHSLLQLAVIFSNADKDNISLSLHNLITLATNSLYHRTPSRPECMFGPGPASGCWLASAASASGSSGVGFAALGAMGCGLGGADLAASLRFACTVQTRWLKNCRQGFGNHTAECSKVDA